jgi:hypothetical protein
MDPTKTYPQSWAGKLRDLECDGQICLGTPFGDWLRRLGADSRFRRFVEIGTWNGRGSTLCLLEGMAQQGRGYHPTLLSVEANEAAAAAARELYQWRAGVPIKVLHGRVAERMMEDGEILAHPLFERVRGHHRLHGQAERRDFASAPLLSFSEGADVVVLDGGEFSGWADWEAAQRMGARVVCMDDTQVMKNRDTLADAVSKGWRVLGAGEDRNGWAVLAAPTAAYIYDTWK